jgi:hypothetical protein
VRKKNGFGSDHSNLAYLGISTRDETDSEGNTFTRIYFDRVYPTNYFINSFGEYFYYERDSFLYQSVSREELRIEYCRFVIDSVREILLLNCT